MFRSTKHSVNNYKYTLRVLFVNKEKLAKITELNKKKTDKSLRAVVMVMLITHLRHPAVRRFNATPMKNIPSFILMSNVS